MKVELGAPARGPLADVRVLDFSTVVSGPLCTQILGDLGADVVKVEAPRGDSARMMGPPFRGGQSPVSIMFNRNKRCITLDLQAPRGVEVARRLAERADVLVENFRPGVADRLGIGHEVLLTEHPRLVYVSINGFGSEGPYAHHPAYDTVIQGLSGFMQCQGTAEEPSLVRGIAADKTTGMTAASAVIAALFARERNGHGQRVEVPMLDAYAAFALPDVLGPESFHPVEEMPPSMPTPRELHRTWKTADGFVVMMVVEDDQFRGICRAVNREDLIEDPRCENLITRITHGRELFALLETEVAKWPTAELVARGHRHGVPIAPANGIREFMEDPQVRDSGIWFEVEHPEAGTLRQLRHPARYSRTPATLRHLPPNRGEHTDEVLAEADYSPDETRNLREAGVVA